MHGSDRVPDLNIDYERALVGRAKATASTRAKWRSSTSACCSVLEKGLTPPTLSETRFIDSYRALGARRYFLPNASSPSVACLTITSGPFVLPAMMGLLTTVS